MAVLDLDNNGVALFPTGFGTNTGVVSAFVKPGGHVVLDQFAHASLVEGATLSGAHMHCFRHNDTAHLAQILKGIADEKSRILVCAEGTYSADGDFGNLQGIVEVAKSYGAYVLVDEAHSMLLTGPSGRGLCAAQGVLADVDLLVITLSKGMGALGGAVIAKKEIARYISWYARSRMFSNSLPPAETGGLIKVLELASGPDGDERRARLHTNADFLRTQLRGKVNIGASQSWIVPVIYGSEKLTFPVNDYLQRAGLLGSPMQFPAALRGQARVRLFVTSEHTQEQLAQGAEIILEAAERFGFSQIPRSTG